MNWRWKRYLRNSYSSLYPPWVLILLTFYLDRFSTLKRLHSCRQSSGPTSPLTYHQRTSPKWIPLGVDNTEGCPGNLLHHSFKQLRGNWWIPQPAEGFWKNWQKPAKGENSHHNQLFRISACGAQLREENKISHCLFLSKSRPIGYWLSVPETPTAFLLV